ncbi:MAG: 30S ribosomal protein S18 [Myxococcota bacterium]|nr:30S ribosomal protein S18 [Myxococcota bacterium]
MKCRFCGEEAPVLSYSNADLLRDYIDEAGRLRSRMVTGLCVQHQREMKTAVERARGLALLPRVEIGG